MRFLTNKFLLLALFCAFTYTVSAQEYVINWQPEPKEILTDNGTAFVLNFDGASHNEQFGYLPGYSIKKAGKITSSSIENAKYETLSDWENTFVKAKYLATEPITELLYLTESGQPKSAITVIPLRVNPTSGLVEKLISFNLKTSVAEVDPISAKTTSTVTESVLAEGTVYKLRVSSEEIHKIDYSYLKSLGIDVDNINPNNIHIYGNGGGMLPQANDEFRYEDLPENDIFIQGGNDGSFDQNDFILFMGLGQTKWKYDENTNRYVHTKNVYADNNVYFLKIDSQSGKRVSSVASASGATQTLSIVDQHVVFEEDKNSLLKSGREWYGDIFDFTTSRNYAVPTPLMVTGSDVKITSGIMVSSTTATSFNVYANGVLIGKNNNTCSSTPCATTDAYGRKGSENNTTFNVNASSIGNPSAINFQYDFNKNGNNSAIGYLNYILVNYSSYLLLSGNSIQFRAIKSLDQPVTEFKVGNAGANTLVWDITNPIAPLMINGTLNGSNFSFSVETDSLREFIAFNKFAEFPAPEFAGIVKNQNIHGILTPPDLLIVTHPSLLGQARRLANFRRANDNLTVLVLTTVQIYNEFSSGYQDISAIRDCAKMLYDRGDASNSLKYLLLFGDASYDYKDRILFNTNLVPVYESRQSLDNIKTYSSDDYFGFLDDNEGQWEENGTGNHLLDVGVGRLPVKSILEAEYMVNKLINYARNLNSFGDWRNKIAFVADDGDNNLHLDDADDIADKIEANYPTFNIEKIYLDAYTQLSTPAGQVSPQVNTAIEKAIENGVLILNYTGHGGETGWAEERILTASQLSKFENTYNLPIFVTATCEFGRYEDPSQNSAAEVAILNPLGGAIGLLTTTRPVYAFSNEAINSALYDHIFETSDSLYKRFGEVIKDTKNTPSAIIGINNRNFSLLGDPSMALALPQKRIVVTHINGSATSSDADTIKALQTLTLKGQIQHNNGSKINDFNGELDIIVFDKKNEITTLGNQNPTTKFQAQNNYLYRGKASIVDGEFSVSFIVPKDISYQYDFGKMSFYARRDNGFEDATGDYTNIVIGGSESNVPNDETPPTIKLYMDDESFIYAGTTGSSPLFIAKLSDDNGINLASGGIGHDIEAILDGEKIIMNEYYTAEKDDYTQGTVLYNFKDLAAGTHTIILRAWDTHNNSNSSKLVFIVEPDNQIVITYAFNYPNPFNSSTNFAFDHNRAGEDLELTLKIYNMTGSLIKTIEKSYENSDSRISDIVWDADDQSGKKIPDGIYIYHLNVRSLADGTSAYKTQKLVIFK